jgi:glycosyltransferase involved in cell wall biosynthesis
VEPENPEQLAEKIQYVLDNPEEAEAMGSKARQKCIEKYSWDAMEEILLKVFEKYE